MEKDITNKKSAPARLNRRFKLAPATNVRALIQKVGITKAAGVLGLSSGGIHSIIDKEGNCRIAYEMAAAFALEQRGNDPLRDKLLIIKVSPEQRAAIQPVMEMMGIRIAFVDNA